jgi:hypothetical protein
MQELIIPSMFVRRQKKHWGIEQDGFLSKLVNTGDIDPNNKNPDYCFNITQTFSLTLLVRAERGAPPQSSTCRGSSILSDSIMICPEEGVSKFRWKLSCSNSKFASFPFFLGDFL